VDGVLLALRISKKGTPYAERAKEILTTLGATVLGVVVNAIDRHAGVGAYSYEHYGYGNAYHSPCDPDSSCSGQAVDEPSKNLPCEGNLSEESRAEVSAAPTGQRKNARSNVNGHSRKLSSQGLWRWFTSK
jgi:hypothetical protein